MQRMPMAWPKGAPQATREARQQMDDYVCGTGRDRLERFNGLLDSVGQALDQVQERLAESVLEIACDVARQVLRRELQVDQRAVMPVVREALAMLRADGRVATVRLDPEDLELLRASLSEEETSGQPVTWLADGSVGAGGCQVESAGAVVDGRLPARWKRAVAALGREEAWDSDGDAQPHPNEASADVSGEPAIATDGPGVNPTELPVQAPERADD
jgi:flagellar assembly protein FliH